VGFRPARSIVGILEYVKNMPSGTNSHYKENELPEGNRFKATNIQTRTVCTTFLVNVVKKIAKRFLKWYVHYRVRISRPLTLIWAK
jgi:hypothetical protein